MALARTRLLEGNGYTYNLANNVLAGRQRMNTLVEERLDKFLEDFFNISEKGRDKMYHVKITQWVETERLTAREHTVISEDYNDDGKLIKEYGYPRQVKTKGEKEIVVLEQTVEEFDLGVVIAAINGLELKDG